MISPDSFKQTLARFASGVTVVTAVHNGETRGLTVSAFISVSLEPPLVLVSIEKTATAHATLKRSRRYGVSILSRDQEALSNHFAGFSKVEDIAYEYVEELPLVKGAIAHLVCKTVDEVEAGDHTLFIGEVEWAETYPGEPLLYYASRYGNLASAKKPV